MPSYKLTYFNARGRAEVARLIFAAAVAKYEDVRIEFPDWPALKEKTPQGSLPVLEIDGKVTICQSQSVNRYLARTFKLYGANDLEMAQVDQIMDTCLDLGTPFISISFEKDEAKKAEGMKTFKEETSPKIFRFIENIMKQSGKKGFAVGSSLTVADLTLFALIELIGQADDLSGFKLIAENRKTVAALPKIKAYIDKRPPAAF